MLKSDLLPPQTGVSADPILYGVAVGLADLFPLVVAHNRPAREPEAEPEAGVIEDHTERE